MTVPVACHPLENVHSPSLRLQRRGSVSMVRRCTIWKGQRGELHGRAEVPFAVKPKTV